MERERITLEKVIEIIGEDAGYKYAWFLIDFEAQGIINENLTVEDICDEIRSEDLGYYEVTWDFVKALSKKLSAVVIFDLIACKDKEAFLKERSSLMERTKEHVWGYFRCELKFYIEDGEIWEITGSDIALVERLKDTFSRLPTLLE